MTRPPDGDLAARLASVEVLQDLDEPARLALASELEVVRLAAGEALVRQGDDADCLFLILDGRLAVQLDRQAREGQPLAEAFADLRRKHGVPG